MNKQLDRTLVAHFWNTYRRKSIANPGLYRSTDTTVTIILPQYLIEFAEQASGHSGYVTGCRPLGIRRHNVNADQFLKSVFHSIDTLYAFIMSSAADAVDYTGDRSEVRPVRQARQRVEKMSPIAQPKMAKDDFWSVFTINDLKMLRDTHGVDIVNQAMIELTFADFRDMFAI